MNPTVTIPKVAQRTEHCRRRILQFQSARTAFKALLRGAGLQPKEQVLLPAYIGWTQREGSGVMDPIRDLGLVPVFYQITPQLRIDLDDLRRCLRTSAARVLLLIHYFGFPDPEFASACELARADGLIVVEDEAHAMFSDLAGGVCGRSGDFSIMSLHKLLPVPTGGLLVVNNANHGASSFDYAGRAPADAEVAYWEYDVFSIAQRRRQNAESLVEFLAEAPEAQVLTQLTPGVVPQSLPVVINSGRRDDLYTKLNAEGFGVVSLYHTLISEVGTDDYPAAHWLSKRILNLPVHQDADRDSLKRMVSRLSFLLRQ